MIEDFFFWKLFGFDAGLTPVMIVIFIIGVFVVLINSHKDD